MSSCDSRGSVQTVEEEIGEKITFYCHLLCGDSKYNFYHINNTEQPVLIYQGRHKLIITIKSFDDAGEYYCQCSRDTDQDKSKKCWLQVTSKNKPNLLYKAEKLSVCLSAFFLVFNMIEIV